VVRLKHFLSDATLSAASQGIGAMITLGLQIATVRLSTPAVYGTYATAAAVVAIVETVFVARGGEVAISTIGRYWGKDMPRARWLHDYLVRNDLRLNVAVFVAFAALSFALAPLLEVPYGYLIGLSLSIPAQIGYGATKSVFVVRGEFRVQGLFEVGSTLLAGALSVVGLLGFGIYGLIGGSVLGAFLKAQLSARMSASWWPKEIAPLQLDAEAGRLTSAIRVQNLQSVLRNGLSSGVAQADVLLLSSACGAEAVAIYRIAKTLAAVPTRLAAPIWSAVRPRLLDRVRHHDLAGIRRLLAVPAVCLLAAAVFAAPLLELLGEPLVEFAYGPSYGGAIAPFRLLVVSTWALGAVTGWLGFVVVVSDAKHFGILSYGLQLVLLVLLGAWFGRESPTRMAMVVLGTSLTVAILAWSVFLRSAAWFPLPARSKSVTVR
jgi:O-antigen/teichoic acid export membrane protein